MFLEMTTRFLMKTSITLSFPVMSNKDWAMEQPFYLNKQHGFRHPISQRINKSSIQNRDGDQDFFTGMENALILKCSHISDTWKKEMIYKYFMVWKSEYWVSNWTVFQSCPGALACGRKAKTWPEVMQVFGFDKLRWNSSTQTWCWQTKKHELTKTKVSGIKGMQLCKVYCSAFDELSSLTSREYNY